MYYHVRTYSSNQSVPCRFHVMWETYSLPISCNQPVPNSKKLQTAKNKTAISHSHQVQYFFGYSVSELISWHDLTEDICVILHILRSRDQTNQFLGWWNQHIYWNNITGAHQPVAEALALVISFQTSNQLGWRLRKGGGGAGGLMAPSSPLTGYLDFRIVSFVQYKSTVYQVNRYIGKNVCLKGAHR